jgi:hypothetical protein
MIMPYPRVQLVLKYRIWLALERTPATTLYLYGLSASRVRYVQARDSGPLTDGPLEMRCCLSINHE